MASWTRNLAVTAGATALVVTGNVASHLLAAEPDAAPADDALAADLDAILTDPRLDGGQASVVVRDAATGETLYEHDGDQRLMPASNEKLLTSAVALDVLGPDYTFATTVATTGQRTGPILRGDVYLRGTGDPTLLASDYAELAKHLADDGVRVVSGRVLADDSWFDDVRLGNDWAWDDEPYYYAAPVSALTVAPDTDYDAGTVIVNVDPAAAPGAPAVVTLTPHTDAVTIVNEATTGAAGSGNDVSVEREHGGDRIVVSGTVAAGGSGASEWASVWEPTDYATDVFVKALADAGVRVTGGSGRGVTPSGATVVAEHESMPLSDLLVPFLKLSNNGHAEVLIKAMGREISGAGTWAAGLAVLRAELPRYGVDTATVANRDGSGLSRRNLIPAAELADLLVAAQDRPWFDAWYEALPIAGVSDRMVGGTLRSRMRGTPAAGNVHAKTGSLTGASSLSGYVDDADGRRLVFSIVFNDHLSGKPSDLEDHIAVRLAAHTEDGAARLTTADVPSVDLPDDVECSWVKAC
ncbi:D-alanyl-D-alanine carboxypeptidase/D-alanyl-D-alanine-endopeptidase [Jiangella aurantiaca]|uniref:D-alanyl-D-alanine carboxypeptidase/D-alanyl-D-alanine-endopeptidase n=1 Tax=Jiangella aurantiaca TaxID=2530373 RepID=A0A4R5A587_9ACTN|nr:D-alanyl-D-alanine carboxypeptidase/D-alanyl-D-alanine-endopeptidase [Jiangella aurantiaca]TDD65879.1 D-alanyl-D-alanine carboxypeptidase/D-alanyl-D-alanine-endopeptidase [Jiangella aurantiaca]